MWTWSPDWTRVRGIGDRVVPAVMEVEGPWQYAVDVAGN